MTTLEKAAQRLEDAERVHEELGEELAVNGRANFVAYYGWECLRDADEELLNAEADYDEAAAFQSFANLLKL